MLIVTIEYAVKFVIEIYDDATQYNLKECDYVILWVLLKGSEFT
jgi:hypothetical protein